MVQNGGCDGGMAAKRQQPLSTVRELLAPGIYDVSCSWAAGVDIKLFVAVLKPNKQWASISTVYLRGPSCSPVPRSIGALYD